MFKNFKGTVITEDQALLAMKLTTLIKKCTIFSD